MVSEGELRPWEGPHVPAAGAARARRPFRTRSRLRAVVLIICAALGVSASAAPFTCARAAAQDPGGAVPRQPLPRPIQNAVLEQMEARRYAEALALARGALRDTPGDVVLVDQAAALFSLRDSANAGEAFLESLSHLGGRSDSTAAPPGPIAVAFGTLYLESGEYARAVSLYRDATKSVRARGGEAALLVLLVRLGDAFKRSHQDSAAIGVLEEAVDLRMPGGLVHYHLEALDLLSTVLSRIGEVDRSVDLIRRGVGIARAAGDRGMEMRLERTLGANAYAQARYRAARECYRRAAVLAREIGDFRTEALRLRRVADCSARLGYGEEAAGLYAEAAAAARRGGGRNEEADVLCSLAALRLQQGNPQAALGFCGRASDLLDEEDRAGARVWSAVRFRANSTRGLALEAMGRLREAVAVHRRNERLLPRLSGAFRNSHRTNLANCLSKLGDLDGALELHREALQSARKRRDRRDETLCLGNIASIYAQQGRYEAALEAFREGRSLAEDAQDPERLSHFLRDEASIYVRLGDEEEARRLLRSSLSLAEKSGFLGHEAAALSSLAELDQRQGETEAARRDLERALAISRRTREPARIYPVLRSLAKLSLAEGDLKGARSRIRVALQGEEGPISPAQTAEFLTDLGDLALRRRDEAAARDLFSRADSLASGIESPELQYGALVGLARAERALGNRTAACGDYRRAIRAVEAIRRGTGAEEERWNILADHSAPYRSAATLLLSMAKGGGAESDPAEAFRLAEMSHARTLLDRLKQAGIRLDRSVPRDLLRDRAENLRRYDYVHSRFLEARAARSADDGARAADDRVSSRVDSLRAMLEDLNEEYDRIEGRTRRYLAPYVELPPFVSISVPAFRAALDSGTLFLEFLIADREWILFSISRRGGLMAHRIDPAEKEVRELRSILEAAAPPDRNVLRRYGELAGALFRKLLAPALDAQGGAFRSLVVVPDGILWTVPFESFLTEPAETAGWLDPVSFPFLYRSYDLVYAPSATALMSIAGRSGGARSDGLWTDDARSGGNTAAKPSSSGRALILAGPSSDLSALPYGESEGDTIARLLGRDHVDLYTGKAATEKVIKTVDLRGYEILHLAAHSFVDESHPLLSSVVLSTDPDHAEDGYLAIREIYDLKMNADLAVLSSCSSAAGAVVQGEGVIALARAFVAAGARSALVSLWPVDDASTKAFMEFFYRRIAVGAPVAEALRAARDSMLASSRPAWTLPQHWAPFVLFGAPLRVSAEPPR